MSTPTPNRSAATLAPRNCPVCGVQYRLTRRYRPKKTCSNACGHLLYSPPLEDKFWRRVQKSDGCWNWIGFKNRKGYGTLTHRGKTYSAHRLSFQIQRGEIPKGEGPHGTCVLHRCDNPACVNPDHLFLGSNRDNIDDMLNKGRHRPRWGAKGAINPSAKLTEAQAQAILDDPRPRFVIAREYGISWTMVNRIKTGENWKHLKRSA